MPEMTNGPFFSVILTTYNRATVLVQAIESVLNQTFLDFELLIVDDGSPDNTRQQVEKYADKRLSYFYQVNKGAGAARNAGISNARGRYICFLDDDDAYLPNHLAALNAAIIAKKEPVAMFRTFAEVHTKDRATEKQAVVLRNNQHALEYIFKNVMYLPNVCVHNSVFQKQVFNETLPLNIDYDMWIRILLEYPLYEVEEITTIINFHGGDSISAGSERAHEQYIIIWKKIFDSTEVRKHLPLNYRKKTLFNRYYWLALEQSQNKKSWKAFVSCLHAAQHDPSFLISKNMISVLRRSF
jgi:glycosyltransferase involved in cell wall biosynthesis